MKLATIFTALFCLKTCFAAATNTDVRYSTARYKYTLYVNTTGGSNTEECWSGVIPCETLNYAADVAEDSTAIIVDAAVPQELFSVAVFRDLVNITISSYRPDTPAVVQCHSNDTGLKFVNVTNLLITNIRFLNCGSVQSSSSPSYKNPMETLGIVSAVYLLNCTQVTLQSIACISGPGTGVAMYDVSGDVFIKDCEFISNGNNSTNSTEYPGGSGLYIELTNCSVGNPSCTSLLYNSFAHDNNYQISGCTFTNNHASVLLPDAVTFVDKFGLRLQRLGWGGGLMVAVMGSASGNNFIIENCTFSGNIAPMGGAIAFQVTQNASRNIIDVSFCLLENNTARHGGGGIHFGYIFHNRTLVMSNTCNFHNITFSHNTALYGGGTGFYSTRAQDEWNDNHTLFTDCVWDGNRADIGAAVALFPEDWALINQGYLPVPQFESCNFSENVATANHREEMLGVGVLFSDQFSINLKASVTLMNNRGSAIYITAGRIHILPNANVSIIHNHADRGAGISLMGYAGITAYENSNITFEENHALEYGGAIYYGTIDKLDYVNSRRCFIRYQQILPPDQWKTSFHFINNTAEERGYSIYASSLLPCAKASNSFSSSTSVDTNNFTSVLKWKNTFTYDPENRSLDISTDVSDIQLVNDPDADGALHMFPGLPFELPLVIKDELDNNVSAVFETSSNSASNLSCDISEAFEFVSNKIIQIDGSEHSWINFTLRTVSDRQVGITVLSDLTRCPLGYVLDENVCVCSTSTTTPYDGIVACNETYSRGILKNGYWAGCYYDGDGSLLTAPCPLGYCADPDSTTGTYLLSQECAGIDELLCEAQNRSGYLCGSCTENFTVFYHSDRFSCSNCTQPELGIPLYIISELLPLTALFIIVILFGVSLTSGAANSFILFAQVLDLFGITAFGSIHSPKVILDKFYHFVFGFLNLDFFRIDALSFCLFEGATVLDILAFKYVTAVYGIMLIVVLALLMRFCSCFPKNRNFCGNKVRTACRSINNSAGSAIIHGITAFFIITYSQLTKVSFQILTRTILRTENFKPIQMQVVFLSGETEFFSPEHLRYAIPAMLVVLFAILVPLVLILHPLYYLCKKARKRNQYNLADSTVIWRQHHCIPSSSEFSLLVKPFFDEFQSCFRDSMRFFGGLYFVYRLVISACMAFSQSAIEMYGWLEVVLIIMFTIHAVCQPYEKRFFNILDSLIFACLAIINGISLSNYAETLYAYQLQGDQGKSAVTTYIQLILVYAPILYMVTFVFLKVLCWYAPIRKKLTGLNKYIPLFDVPDIETYERMHDHEDVEDGRFDEGILPARMFDRNENIQGIPDRPLVCELEQPEQSSPEQLLPEQDRAGQSRQRKTFPGAMYGSNAATVQSFV